MAIIIRVIGQQPDGVPYMGLKLIDDDRDVVKTDEESMFALTTAPITADLQKCSRVCLLDLGGRSTERFPNSANKTRLSEIVHRNWRQITQSCAHGSDIDGVFWVFRHRLGYFDDDDASVISRGDLPMDYISDEARRELGLPLNHEIEDAQPHRQPSVDVDYPTPRSLSTQGVLQSSEPEHLSSDVSEAGLEDGAGIEFFEQVGVKSLDQKVIRLIPEGGFTINVVVPMKDTEVRFKVKFNQHTLVQNLMDEVASLTGHAVRASDLSFYVRDVSSEIFAEEPIAWFCDEDGTLLMRPKFRGGVRGRPTKKFMLKDEAMTDLKQRVKRNVMKTIEEEEVNLPSLEALPEAFKAFVEEMKGQTSTLDILRSRVGSQFVQTCLRQVDLVNLKVLLEILTKKSKKHLTVDEKVAKGLEYVFPVFKTLDDATAIINNLRAETLANVMEIVVTEYNVYAGGQMTIDIEKFAQQVTTQIAVRETNSAPPPAEVPIAGCFIR